MLQRTQSLWLFLAAVCGALSMNWPFYSGSVQGTGNIQVSSVLLTATYDIVNLFCTVVVSAGSLVAIFYYKKRKWQFLITLGLFIFSILNIFQYYRETQKFTSGVFSLTALFTLAIPILLFFAMRGIRRDEKLVKSLDRLR
ncbi:MAG: DUF4293 domain-containing protein [Bacteroidota bacterium]|nr:DUF4293 domain-containing protein [Bacteroidota bacterium]